MESQFINVIQFMDENGLSHSVSIILSRYLDKSRNQLRYSSYLSFKENTENSTNKCTVQVNSLEYTSLLEQLKYVYNTKKGRGKFYKYSERKQLTIRTKYENEVFSIYMHKINIKFNGERVEYKYMLLVNPIILEILINQLDYCTITVENAINSSKINDKLSDISRDIEMLLMFTKKH